MLEEATQAYQEVLAQDVGAVRYLLDRGIGQAEAMSHRFGVVGDEPFPGHGGKRGWLAIPYLDRHGYPLTIRFRCLQDHKCRENGHGKYATLKDDHPRPYNIGAIHRASDTIEITEGEFDAAILQKVGLHAVAIPGAHLWSPAFRRMLAGFNTIRIWADPDDAGAEMTAKITKSLRQAKALRMPVGRDVSDVYKLGGADALYKIAGIK